MKAAVILGALFLAGIANASVITINFNLPAGDLGTSHTYTTAPYSILATAFGPSNPDLYGKNDGGSENGLGLSNDSDHEITFNNFIQLDLVNILGFSPFTIIMGSTTAGETWEIRQSGVSGTLGSLLLSGTDEGAHQVSTNLRYLDITVASNTAGWNVLLGSLSFNNTVPEPGSVALVGGGLALLGFIRRRKKSA